MTAAVKAAPSISDAGAIAMRVHALDWTRVIDELDERGCALVPALIEADECAQLAELYASEHIFRSRVVMARHGFGRGEYKYFGYPLPGIVHGLRVVDRRARNMASCRSRWRRSTRLNVPPHVSIAGRHWQPQRRGAREPA